MSGSYMNTGGGRGPHAPAAPPEPRHRQPRGATQANSSSASTSSLSVAERGRQPSARRRSMRRQRQQRPHSVLSQGLSQAYDLEVDGRPPPCLHRAAVSPALWLLCQTVLVVLFALCCAFLTRGPAAGSADRGRLLGQFKPWMRLEFKQNHGRSSSREADYMYNTTAKRPFGRLLCTVKDAESSEHCEDMKNFFKLTESDVNGSMVTIRKAAVYRINAAVTYQISSPPSGFPVDFSVMINHENWITCQEGVNTQYVHCTLFGIRYLPEGANVSFVCDKNLTIAAHGGSTFFEIETR